MLLEATGAATAAAGGFVLRQALKISVTSTHTNEKTMTVGNVSGSVLNQGDISGSAVFTAGGAPPPAADLAAPPSPSTGRKPPIGRIVLGVLLIIGGIAMICAGLFMNQGYSTV